MSKNIYIIVGSVREARSGEAIAQWVFKEANLYKGDLDLQLIDLKEVNLPFMDEPMSPRKAVEYVHDHTRKWSDLIALADGYIFVTPEYNHGYPPVLKNAIDYLYKEWTGKPVGFIGYAGRGAQDSIRQLREVVTALGMKPLKNQVSISQIWTAFDENGNVKPENVSGKISELMTELKAAL